jgi:hypothetical protein
MVLTAYPALPGDEFATVAGGIASADLIQRREIRTTRFRRTPQASLVLRRQSVHRIPPRVDDVAQRPSIGTGPNRYIADFTWPSSAANSEIRKLIKMPFSPIMAGHSHHGWSASRAA